jgi:hypothetical protein
MQNLGSFFDKFKNIITGTKFQKDAIVSIVNSISKTSIKDTNVNVKDHIIYITAHPLIRNEIFMRKQKILSELKNHLGSKAPIDLR